jgi:hypothetical protein
LFGSHPISKTIDGTLPRRITTTVVCDPVPMHLARNIRRCQSFSRMWMKRLISMGVLLVAVIGAASAQAPPATTTPSVNGEQKCTPSEAKPQEGTVAPREGTASQGGATLGDKLAQSDGVICPPANVDPEMRAPAPRGGPMGSITAEEARTLAKKRAGEVADGRDPSAENVTAKAEAAKASRAASNTVNAILDDFVSAMPASSAARIRSRPPWTVSFGPRLVKIPSTN